MKRVLTDKFIRSLKPAPAGKRVDYWDTKFDGFGLRVSDTGGKTYVLYRRWPPSNVPARRRIGSADEITLADARGIAAEWVRQIALGKDPKEEQRRAALEEQRRRKITFAAVAEAWFADEVRKQRSGHVVERDVRREYFPIWEKRPITDISTLDVREAIKAKAVKTPATARNHLGYLRRLFGWAADQHVYGLTDNPAAILQPKKLIGKKVIRKRVLTEVELRALWATTAPMTYPYHPLFRLLLLTGQRKSEVAEARWREFDLEKRLWTIPAARMKMDVAHVVPLTDGAIEILEALPKFKKGDHLFSTSFGAAPVDGFGKAKERLDRAMAAELGGPPEHFVIHDIRRTMRTGLSALPIPDVVRERVVAHATAGMHAVYDQYSYADEKRHALELWEARLLSIVGDNVVPMRSAG